MGYNYKYVFISHGQKLSTVFWYSPVELTEKPIFRDLDNSEMLFQSKDAFWYYYQLSEQHLKGKLLLKFKEFFSWWDGRSNP